MQLFRYIPNCIYSQTASLPFAEVGRRWKQGTTHSLPNPGIQRCYSQSTELWHANRGAEDPSGQNSLGRTGLYKNTTLFSGTCFGKGKLVIESTTAIPEESPWACSPSAVRTPSSFVVKFFSSDSYCFNCPGKSHKYVHTEEALDRFTPVLL